MKAVKKMKIPDGGRIWLFFTASFVAHFTVFGLIYFFNFSETKLFSPVEEKASFIKSKKEFIRVDVVSMPKISMTELKKIKPISKKKLKRLPSSKKVKERPVRKIKKKIVIQTKEKPIKPPIIQKVALKTKPVARKKNNVTPKKVPIVKVSPKRMANKKSVLNKVNEKTSQLMERLKSYDPSQNLKIEFKKKEKSVINKVSLKASQLMERLKSYDFQKDLKDNPVKSELVKIKKDVTVKASQLIERLKSYDFTKKNSQTLKKEVPSSLEKELTTKIKREPKSHFKSIFKEQVISKQNEEKVNILDIVKKLGNKKVKTMAYAPKKNAKKSKLQRQREKEINSLLIEGNKLSKGHNLTDGGTLSKEEELRKVFENYAEQLRSSVKSYWKLPEYLKEDSNLRCRVQIFLSSEGELLNIDIYESSGNEEYDKRAIQTVKNAAPFPPAKKDIAERILSGDLILGFPL